VTMNMAVNGPISPTST